MLSEVLEHVRSKSWVTGCLQCTANYLATVKTSDLLLVWLYSCAFNPPFPLCVCVCLPACGRLPVTVPCRPDVRAAVRVAGGAGAGRCVPLAWLRGRGGVRGGLCP